MVARVVVGRRSPTEIGMWATRPGVDAMTATLANDLVIGPNLKNAQVLFAGTVAANAGFMPYPTGPLTFIPLVFAKMKRGADYTVPFYELGFDGGAVYATATLNGISLTSAASGVVYFVVIRNAA